MNKKCECGRALCDLCEENRAVKVMSNKLNGKTINVCEQCYQELWGGKP